MRLLTVCLIGAFFTTKILAEDVTVQSGPGRTSLLELFTSEGCSSCPPAESWFSSLRQSPRLWKDVVPVSFHVNYWDNLGWKDPLASQDFTDRQRTYAAAWGADTVYTPGFVLNGGEWRARSLEAIPTSQPDPGKLTATLRDNGEVEITFHDATQKTGAWQAHAALLGYGVHSNVGAGENSGRHLVHDFVALVLESGAMKEGTAVLHLPADKITHEKSALAVWVTAEGQLEPVQAAGGDL